jgi:hypothetical protein
MGLRRARAGPPALQRQARRHPLLHPRPDLDVPSRADPGTTPRELAAGAVPARGRGGPPVRDPVSRRRRVRRPRRARPDLSAARSGRDAAARLVMADYARKSRRTGYPTQKPEALVARFIAASSEPGDLVADLFAGSGTTPATAAVLGRRWLAGDASPAAIAATRRRLLGLPDAGGGFEMAALADAVAPGAALDLVIRGVRGGGRRHRIAFESPARPMILRPSSRGRSAPVRPLRAVPSSPRRRRRGTRGPASSRRTCRPGSAHNDRPRRASAARIPCVSAVRGLRPAALRTSPSRRRGPPAGRSPHGSGPNVPCRGPLKAR